MRIRRARQFTVRRFAGPAALFQAAAICLTGCSPPDAPAMVAVDLLREFPRAERRSTQPLENVRLEVLTIRNDSKPGIVAHPYTRITWRVRVSPRAELRTAAAVAPQAWDDSSDGVVFRIGISDRRIYEELLVRRLDPRQAPHDRGWIPLTVDLSSYGGRQWSLFYRPGSITWDLVFSTDPGLPGTIPDTSNGRAWWGAPAIYVPAKR